MTIHGFCASSLLAFSLVTGALLADEPTSIGFDVSSVAVAREASASESTFVPPGYRWVTFHLDISALIDSTSRSKPHEFLYQVTSASRDASVVDYSPRTQLSDTVIGGIQEEKCDEKASSLGLGIKGTYHGIVHADGGADTSKKSSTKTKVQRVAPQEIVYASGTIDRGRGVYFKLRSTPTHVLDGQKRFAITMQVPENWRGDLVDVQMSAVLPVRSFKNLQRQSTAFQRARFQVAVFAENDEIARRWAWQLAEAEQNLRHVASREASNIRDRSVPTIFHHVAIALDVMQPKIAENWLARTLHGSVDPYFDRQIRQLPVDVKVAVLDYLDCKSKYAGLTRSQETSREAHSELVLN